jgi:hypothetical protein
VEVDRRACRRDKLVMPPVRASHGLQADSERPGAAAQ